MFFAISVFRMIFYLLHIQSKEDANMMKKDKESGTENKEKRLGKKKAKELV